MYTIKRAAERVGVSAATLRAWERRYDVVTPQRSEGGYRVYDEDAVRALQLMADLVADGWTPSLAALEVRRRSVLIDATDPVTSSPAANGRAPTDGRAPVDPDGVLDELLAGAATMDARRVAAALDQMFALGSFEAVVDNQLMPAMVALGEAWAIGRVTVAGEHLAANAAMRRLAAAYEAAAPYGGGGRVVVGLPPRSRHEIGALAFAVAASRRGLAIDYLGADLPISDWSSVVRERDVIAVVLAIPTAEDIVAATEVVEAVRVVRSSLLVAVGGGQQGAAPVEAVRLGHQIAEASHTLAALLS